jgi:hypothetical protein
VPAATSASYTLTTTRCVGVVHRAGAVPTVALDRLAQILGIDERTRYACPMFVESLSKVGVSRVQEVPVSLFVQLAGADRR